MIQAESLGELLRKQAARIPQGIALLSPEKGGFREITYQEFYENVSRCARVLTDLGLKQGNRAAILAENCVEWAYFDWACSALGVVSVPIYPSLPADQVQFILRDCGAELAVAGSAELSAKIAGVKTIALIGDDSLMSRAAQAEPATSFPTMTRDDPFTIIYTSGTSGVPKGAILAHRTPLHVCRAAMEALRLDERDRFLSFLPMCHVYERIAGQCLPIAMGASIAYAKNLASLMGDMQRARPTIMLCVPRFLESLHDRVMDNVAKEKPLKQRLFRLALAQGISAAKGGFAPLRPILDRIVFAKIRERTGGKLRFFVSGGAALPTHVAEFLMASGLTVLQGYGLTETGGGTCVNRPDDNKYWTVGEPLDMEVRIADDGEILVRGPAVMLGYYNLPEENAAAIDAEGWFHTGDIGEFEGKQLKITDRKKDLIVLGNGKNVAPQGIENRLRASPFIAEAVVFGDSMDHCVALIVPNGEAIRKELGLPEDTVLSCSEPARALVKKQIEGINKTLAPFEMVKKHAILDAPFTIESGELTPTLKVKRRVVGARYADLIRSLG